MKQIPWTSSKKEIYDAYKDILKKYEESLASPPIPQKVAREAEKKEEINKKVSSWTPESLVEGISRMKISIARTLDELSLQLASEAGKLQDIRTSQRLAEADLSKTIDAKIAGQAMELWLADHEDSRRRLRAEFGEEKSQLESEISMIRDSWKLEQADRKKKTVAEEQELKALRKRESEEYEYHFNKQKKMDPDQAEESKTQLEREITTRKREFEDEMKALRQDLESRQARLLELEEQASAWPKTLEKAETKAKEAVTKELSQNFGHQIELLKRDAVSKEKIAENRIQSLEAYLQKQEDRIQHLSEKLEQQNARVHEIANKAVEGASGATAFSAVNKIAMEQAKRPPLERD